MATTAEPLPVSSHSEFPQCTKHLLQQQIPTSTGTIANLQQICCNSHLLEQLPIRAQRLTVLSLPGMKGLGWFHREMMLHRSVLRRWAGPCGPCLGAVVARQVAHLWPVQILALLLFQGLVAGPTERGLETGHAGLKQNSPSPVLIRRRTLAGHSRYSMPSLSIETDFCSRRTFLVNW